MKLLAPIAVIIAAASARQIYNTQSLESYANSAELYQSALEHQQRGLYSTQSGEDAGYEVANHRPDGEKYAKILAYHNENDGHHYQYAYETENGIKAEEAGETLDKGTSAHGAYSYKGDDGQVYTITYTADENGFRPSGAHLPTPPPVPEEILKSLELNAKDEAAGIFDDGKYHDHHELGHQEHHQHHHEEYEGGHQSSVGLHSSGHSGADLAFHAHAPALHSGAKLVYQAPATHGSSSGQQSSSGHYFTSSGHGGISSGHQSSSGHSYFTPSGHGASLGHEESSGHVASLGQQAFAHGAKSSHHFTIGHEGNSGHHMAISHGSNAGQQESSGHGASLQSGFHVSSGHAISNLGYNAPSGFTKSGYSGSSGHVGLSYLPPTGQAGGYHGHQ